MSRIFIFFCFLFLYANSVFSENLTFENIKGVYLPSQRFTTRKMTEINHYADLSGMNAVVLHAKDPEGIIHWDSKNPTAVKIGAVNKRGRLKKALDFFKSKGKWTIAKIDVFSDSKFGSKVEGAGFKDLETGEAWKDKNGLAWSDPSKPLAWNYNIELSIELAKMGFDEIQFDYIRFPSDGELSKIDTSGRKEGFSKPDCLESFLKLANSKLKPLGVTISVDIFGLTAWKKGDFGVGQVLEKISPYVDVICPMFYPSHFPAGFYKLEDPSLYPYKIMHSSMNRIRKRTKKIVRPWLQGFWYSEKEINRQIDAVVDSGDKGWLVWNPTGSYGMTYYALEKRSEKIFPPIKFYPEIDELTKENERVISGIFRIVSYTNFQKGFSIISLEKSKNDIKTPFSRPTTVIGTLEEAILDKILTRMDVTHGKNQSKYSKCLKIAKQMCIDIEKDESKLRPFPIFIDWANNGPFSRIIPAQYALYWDRFKKNMLVQSDRIKKNKVKVN